MILLSTGSLRYYGLDRIFEIAGRAGYDGVELIIDDRIDTIHPRYLNELSEKTEMPIRAIHAPFFFIDPPGWAKSSVDKAAKSLAIAEEVGAGVLVLHMPCFTEREYIDWIGSGVARLQARTEVTIGVENMPCVMKPLGRLGAALRTRTYYSIRKSRLPYRLLSLVSTPVFPMNSWDDLLAFDNVVMDTTHMATGGYDLLHVYSLLKRKLVHIHLSNFDGREHVSLDEGVLDMDGFLRKLARDGFAGDITLEFIPDFIGAHDEEAAHEVLSRNLRFVKGRMAEAGREGPRTAEIRQTAATAYRP